MAVTFSSRSRTFVNYIIPQDDVYNFKTCAFFGVFSSFSSSTSDVYKMFYSAEEVQLEFERLINPVQTIRNNDRIAWLISAARRFFQQKPRPTKLMICRIDPGAVDVSGLPEYRAALQNIFDNAPPFYACTLIDTISYNDPNIGEFISEFVKSFYEIMKAVIAKRVLFANCKDPLAAQSMAAVTDVFLYNETCAGETNALDEDIDRVLVAYHSLNFPVGAGGGGSDVDGTGAPILPFVAGSQNFDSESFSAALMGAFFTNPFGRPLTNVTLQNVQLDPLIDDVAYSTLSYGGLDSSCLFANVFANFSLQKSTSFAQVQYGTMASSRQGKIVYLDQIITPDYAEIRTEYDAAVYLINNQVYYDSVGIVAVVNVFKNVLQSMVNVGMIQPFSNNAITYPKFNLSTFDVSGRTLTPLYAEVLLAVHVQKVKIVVNLNLAQ